MNTVASMTIAPADWVAGLRTLREQGLSAFDVLAAIDRIESLEIVVHLVDPDSGRRAVVSTTVPTGEASVPSLVGVFPGAAWHEREAAEMFGITFTDHPDPRPLLLHDVVAAPPLLKSTPLPARLAMSWPGAPEVDQGRRARRPQLPPGVRAEWMAEEPS